MKSQGMKLFSFLLVLAISTAGLIVTGLAAAPPATAAGTELISADAPTMVTLAPGANGAVPVTIQNTGGPVGGMVPTSTTNLDVVFTAPSNATFTVQASVSVQYSNDGVTFFGNNVTATNCVRSNGNKTLSCQVGSANGGVSSWLTGGFFRFNPVVAVDPSAPSGAILTPGTSSYSFVSGVPFQATKGTLNVQTPGGMCTNTVFTLDFSGQVWQVKLGPGGSLAGSAPKLLTKAQPLQNGLAVAAGGSAIYWVNETAGPTVLSKFNPVTGTIATFPAGPHPAGFLVAGAINPLNGWYYFGSIDQSTGILHIYAFNTTTNTVVGEVGTVQFPAGTLNVSDFVFDGLGNLFTSYDNPAGTVQTLVRVNEPIPATAGSPSLTYSPLATLPSAPLPGSTGIAFGSNGNLYINTQTTFYQVNPVTGALLETGPTPSTTTSDNASCSSSGSVTLKKDIVGRSVSTDQFNLAITGSNTTGNTGTTSGSTTGLQTAPGAVAGPVIALTGAVLAFSETAAGGTNLNNYTTTYQCKDQTGTVLQSGSGTTFNFTQPPPVNGIGVAATCIFTNTPKSPNLVVSKSVDPVAGTMVQPGQVLTYTLTFDNTAGTAPAPVAYTDWLGDVLDDSTLVGGSTSSTTTGGTALVVANNASAAPKTLGITGTVAAGAKSTVTYQVTVNSAGNLGDASLENYLTPSTVLTPPTTCPAGSTTCTVNPVGSWSLAKTASPASGTAINPGDPGPARTITYTVTATNSTPNAITGVILTDDLSQVLNNAVFTAGSAKLTINGGSPVAVADPGAGNALVTSSFTLPGNGTAVLSYSVTVNPTAWLVTLKNGATGNGLIPPVRCVTGSAAPLDPACITTHPTTGHLFVQKAGPGPTQGSTAPLTGSTFEIHNDVAGQMGTTTVGVSSPVSGSPGLIEVQNLAAGTYWLLETKAPNGYSLLATPVKFALAPGGTITLDPATAGTSVTVSGSTITVLDAAAVKLPAAGGPGTAGLWGIPVLGILLLMISLALIAYRRADRTPRTRIAERSSAHFLGDN